MVTGLEAVKIIMQLVPTLKEIISKLMHKREMFDANEEDYKNIERHLNAIAGHVEQLMNNPVFMKGSTQLVHTIDNLLVVISNNHMLLQNWDGHSDPSLFWNSENLANKLGRARDDLRDCLLAALFGILVAQSSHPIQDNEHIPHCNTCQSARPLGPGVLLPDDMTKPSPSAGSRTDDPLTQGMVFHGDGYKEFNMAELEAATKYFASDRELGAISCKVYKGTLPDGREVVIKRKSVNSYKKVMEFLAEIRILSPIHHKHIIRLLGSCAVKEERLLVYEYMNNGSLDDHLWRLRFSSSSETGMSYRMCIKILLGVSQAIEYLQSSVPPIIHGDIAPYNILLDATWMPRVSSLSVSRTFDEVGCMYEHGTTPLLSEYMSAEYSLGCIPEQSSDIYSFGILMLETLFPWDELHRHLYGHYNLTLEERIEDVRLVGLKSLLRRPMTQEQRPALQLLVRTAARCVRFRCEDRPAISEVVADLEEALKLVPGDA